MIGFAKTASLPGALFVSAGGYHHHLAANVWDSAGAPPAPEDMAGLAEFCIELPEAEIALANQRIQAAGGKISEDGSGFMLCDPWRTKIRMAPMRVND
jgi:catechol 2,3-dioxygenase